MEKIRVNLDSICVDGTSPTLAELARFLLDAIEAGATELDYDVECNNNGWGEGHHEVTLTPYKYRDPTPEENAKIAAQELKLERQRDQELKMKRLRDEEERAEYERLKAKYGE